MRVFLKDEGRRRFFGTLAAILATASILAVAIWWANGNQMRETFVRHDRCVVSSLMEQGVSEAVIAKAFSDEEITEKGTDLLMRMGISEKTGLFFMPQIFKIQKGTGMLLAGLFFFLWIGLFVPACRFFSAREGIYHQAVRIIDQFMTGDFTEHLPQMEEGCLYRLLGKIDSLANALAAGNEEAVRAKDFLKDTISDISHQLKTPLSALTMYNEIIASDVENKETVLTFTRKTQVALERIEGLIQTLLKVTRLDAGAVVFEKQGWLLADVVNRAVSELLVRAAEEEKEIVLTGEESIWVNCDLQWTSEAIANLAKNALDYTGKGGRIVLSWEQFPEMTRVSVTDNGKGIDEKDIYHIFKRFYRTSRGKGSGQGVGLGLPMARSIIEGQGGTLSVQSRKEEGSVFTVTLPR
ncbi:MAG: HAMP domain-containing histidine kinase [Lachnospiraceae bacterium]|nr:HAMP domain-containing histidine kinase [Lachnospiraceae bacterium]MDE6186281.1 HAMP domain-containing histidine kinase [Lachnospiraceae bacterium]